MYGLMRNPEFETLMDKSWPKADVHTRAKAWEVWKRAYKQGVADAPMLAERWAEIEAAEAQRAAGSEG